MSRALNYLIAIGSILITLGVSAGEVGTLYIKNNCSSALNVWVDEQYQGYVPAGTTRHVVREGFVTFASGRNGKKVEESHGGWVSKGAISVRGQSKAKKNVLASAISLNGDPEKKAYVWFGDGADAGAPLTDRDAEESKQMEPGENIEYPSGSAPLDGL